MEKAGISKSGYQAVVIRRSGNQKDFGIYDFRYLCHKLAIYDCSMALAFFVTQTTVKIRVNQCLYSSHFEKTNPICVGTKQRKILLERNLW